MERLSCSPGRPGMLRRLGSSLLLAPGFADYRRALRAGQRRCRSSSALRPGTRDAFPQAYPDPIGGSVLWICNPHNPTGQLWSRASLEPLLQRFALVICDEAFLPLVPNGEQQSLIPLVAQHANLVVIRSLTKLYGIAGLRLGYAVPSPSDCSVGPSWRDPWPVNGIALAIGERLVGIAAAVPALVRRACSVGRQRRGPGCSGSWLRCRASPPCRRPRITC